jgi:hypothetical protein
MSGPQKITFAEMRSSGVRGLLIYCADYHCSHWTTISGDRWPDDTSLSDQASVYLRGLWQAGRRRAAQLRLGQAGRADQRILMEIR